MTRAVSSLKLFLLLACLVTMLAGCKALGIATQTGGLTQAAVTAPKMGPSLPAPPIVTAFRVEDAENETKVVFESSRPPAFTANLEEKPPRFSIDLTAVVVQEMVGKFTVEKGIIDRVEVQPISREDNLYRMTIGLMKPSTYKVYEDGPELVVALDHAETPAIEEEAITLEPGRGPARIGAVEFEPIGESGRTRLIVKASREIVPQIVTRDNGRTVIMSLSPALIGRDLTRPLNTEYFHSAVNYIKPHTVGGKTVDFMVRLREVVPYQLSQKGAVIHLDFDPSAVPPLDAGLMPPVGETAVTAPLTPPAGSPTPTAPAAASSGIPGSAGSTGGGAAATAAAGTAAPADLDQPGEVFEQLEKSETVSGAKGMVLGRQKRFTGRQMSLDFQNADVPNIIRLIGEVSGKNVVISDRVEGKKVTLRLKNVPWDQALDTICQLNELEFIESGNVIRVDTVAQFIKEKRAIVEEQEQELIRQSTIPLEKKVFTPKYRSAQDLSEEMEKLFMPPSGDTDDGVTERGGVGSGGRIAVIGNDIYVEASNEIMPQMERVFYKLDQPTRQILIEARIVEARTTFSRDLGVTWAVGAAGTSSATLQDDWTVNGAINALPNPSTLGMDLTFGLVSEVFDIDAEIQARQEDGSSNIISAPRIVAQNDEEVYIKQGTKVPYETISEAGTKIEFRDAVLALIIQPHIETNGEIITMDIEVSKDTARYDISTSNPPIDINQAKTRLMVQDGQTIVIGGIITDTEGKSAVRVPELHKVPILGWLFKSDGLTSEKQELLIFLTAHIIPVEIIERNANLKMP